MRLKNSFREIIKHNIDYLFLRFLMYFLIAAFAFLFFVFRRIQDPAPLEFSEKLLYSSMPLLALGGIVALLFRHIWLIQDTNNVLMNIIQQKALRYSLFKLNIEWVASTGLGPARIQVFFIYHGYKILVSCYSEDEDSNYRPIRYVLLATPSIRIKRENYDNSFCETVSILENRWYKLNKDELEAELLPLIKWLEEHKVSPEYTPAGEPITKIQVV